MPEEVAFLIFASMMGCFGLAAMRMRLRSKELNRDQPNEEIDRLADAVDNLADQVRALSDECAELHERVDFAERMMTAQSPRELPAKETTPV